MFSKTFIRRVVKEAHAHEAKAAKLKAQAEQELEAARVIRATIPPDTFAQEETALKAEESKKVKAAA